MPSTPSTNKQRIKALFLYEDDIPNPQFRMLSCSAKEMRERRSTSIIRICNQCNKACYGRDLICSKCQIAEYCSVKCQKHHWISHKLQCTESESAAKLKLVRTLMSSLFIENLLMQASISAFHLWDQMISDKPFIARCDLALDAVPFKIVTALLSGETTPDDLPDGVEGLIQVKSFIPLDSNIAINDPRRMSIWQAAKDRPRVSLDKIKDAAVLAALAEVEKRFGKVEYPTILIDFHLEGSEQVITMPLNVHIFGMQMALLGSSAYIVEDPITRERRQLPAVSSTILHLINCHINEDKKNRLRLRRHMPKELLYKYVDGDKINQEHLSKIPVVMTWVPVHWKEGDPMPSMLNSPPIVGMDLRSLIHQKRAYHTLEDMQKLATEWARNNPAMDCVIRILAFFIAAFVMSRPKIRLILLLCLLFFLWVGCRFLLFCFTKVSSILVMLFPLVVFLYL